MVDLLERRQFAGRPQEGAPTGEDVIVTSEADYGPVGVALAGVREGFGRRRSGRRGVVVVVGAGTTGGAAVLVRVVVVGTGAALTMSVTVAGAET